jgi:hypothetical protein
MYAVGYVAVIAYMVAVIATLALRVKNYTKADGPIAMAVQAKRRSMQSKEIFSA